LQILIQRTENLLRKYFKIEFPLFFNRRTNLAFRGGFEEY